MKIEKTHINDLIIIHPTVYGDERGYFFESYNKEKLNLSIDFIQDNEAFSNRGVLRGLHFQKPPYTQSKLIRCLKGEIIDVVVDLRESSSTYGITYSILLNDIDKKQLLVPKGFAHGYCVLSDSAIVAYKVDENYAPEFEDGILWNDETLNINWNIPNQEIQTSEKDKLLNEFINFKSPFK